MPVATDYWNALPSDKLYWAVLTHDQYADDLSESARHSFFQSGRDHVDIAVLGPIRQSLDPHFEPGRALDFGCGVGRVALALAARCESVVGLDVSTPMLDECRRNAAAISATNVEALPADRLDSLEHVSFDLVHSSLVLQHIRPSTGLDLLSKLAAVVAPGGILAIQVPYAETARPSPARRMLRRVKRAVVPVMEMHAYRFDRIVEVLDAAGLGRTVIQPAHFEGFRSAMIFTQRPRSV